MADRPKKVKKDTISEEDVSKLLQRYSMNTVLGLLQEVEKVAGEKIDWHEVVKNTATGISGAREYQMLWRHLAYGETLIDHLDQDAEPMDDDSDLEYEREPFPAVSRDASAEAAACVKVLIASGYPNASNAPNNSTIEAPLTINIPNSKAVCASSDGSFLANDIQGTNISIPVFVQKQPQPSSVCGEKKPNDAAPVVNLSSRKRRRSWSAEEDMKLAASVQKYGDKSWGVVAKEDFKNDRRPTELSQRWGNLKRKQGTPKVLTSVQPSETLAAAHRAMSMALEGNNLRAPSQIASANQQLGRAGPPKPQLLTNRPLMNPTPTTDSMVKAAAVAAGARIATPADASSLIEAARSQHVVHITTGINHVMKSSTSTANQLPSNVHFIRNGLAKAPISTYSAPKPNISQPVETKQAQNRYVKPPSSVVPNPLAAAQVLNVKSEKENAVVPTTLASEIKVHESSQAAKLAAPVEGAPEDRSSAPGNQSEEAGRAQPSSSGNVAKEIAQEGQTSIAMPLTIGQTTDVRDTLPCSKVESNGKAKPDEIPNSSRMHEEIPSTSKDGAAT